MSELKQSNDSIESKTLNDKPIVDANPPTLGIESILGAVSLLAMRSSNHRFCLYLILNGY